jgi:PAS domain S-box-containing protein
MKYLGIDDGEQNVDAILKLLRDHGYSVEAVTEKPSDMNEELRQPENRYRGIFESAPVGIFRSTLEGKFISVNPAVARILGYDSPEEMIRLVNRTTIADAVYEDPSRRQEILRSALRSNDWQIYEERLRCKDGSIITCNFHYRAVPGQDDSPREFEGFVEDITERKRAEEGLKLSRFIIDKASIGIFRGQNDAKILFANEFGAGMLGYTPEELTTMSFFDIDPSLTPVSWLEHREKLTATGSNTFEAIHRRKDGTFFPVEVTVNLLTYGEQVFSCSFSRDISERKQYEKALRKSEEKFRILAETSAAAIVLYQGERIVYANPATTRMFGYIAEELLEMRFWDCVHPEFQEIVRSRGLARQRGEPAPNQYELKLVVAGGVERWAIVSAGKIEYKGEPACIVTLIDITESKRWQELISSSLAEKELLLKEVHHRVKNNLQIISTLLDLQSESIKDQEALNSFRESQDRIAAMALIHERLYTSKDFASIDFADYIGSLSTHLFESYLVDPGRITLKVDAVGLSIGIDRAIPCGLIINELVTNALKYAFPDCRAGEIFIRFSMDEDGWVTLTVADTGVGLPPGLDVEKTGTLGLQLVNMLVSQLGGQVSVGSGAGASFTIRFCRSRST